MNYGGSYYARMHQPLARTQAAMQGIGRTVSGLAGQSIAKKQLEQGHQLRLAELGLQRTGIEAGQKITELSYHPSDYIHLAFFYIPCLRQPALSSLY